MSVKVRKSWNPMVNFYREFRAGMAEKPACQEAKDKPVEKPKTTYAFGGAGLTAAFLYLVTMLVFGSGMATLCGPAIIIYVLLSARIKAIEK